MRIYIAAVATLIVHAALPPSRKRSFLAVLPLSVSMLCGAASCRVQGGILRYIRQPETGDCCLVRDSPERVIAASFGVPLGVRRRPPGVPM